MARGVRVDVRVSIIIQRGGEGGVSSPQRGHCGKRGCNLRTEQKGSTLPGNSSCSLNLCFILFCCP